MLLCGTDTDIDAFRLKRLQVKIRFLNRHACGYVHVDDVEYLIKLRGSLSKLTVRDLREKNLSFASVAQAIHDIDVLVPPFKDCE